MNPKVTVVTCASALLLSACWGGGGGGGGIGHISQPATHPINDTGITYCGDYAFPDATHNNLVNCATVGATQTVDGVEAANGLDPVPAGQDAVYGRDVSDDSNNDGYQGFNFTKLNVSGNALSIQDQAWSDSGIEGLGTKWSCVRDEVTGLDWEVKTNDNGLRDRDWTYTWYDSNAATNGGNAGTTDAVGVGIGSDNCFNSSRCDTEKYVQDVNSGYLCGHNDWRLPTRDELKTLRLLGAIGPVIDTDYFANTVSASFWVSTPRASSTLMAWGINFASGMDVMAAKSSALSVRLVRDAN